VGLSEIPLDEASREVSDAAHDAARGQVVYLTEHGVRLAAIVPAESAAELEHLTPEAFRELVEEFADVQAARESLAEIEADAKAVSAEQVWAELGIEAEPEVGPELEA
jgi:antitoxin (DNA-binding transcriptional repressor) of toxin-antitoxin stability system